MPTEPGKGFGRNNRKMKYVVEIFQDDKGQFSSKRVAAFITLFYALGLYAIKGESVSYDIFLTLILFVASSLGISSIEKIRKK